MFLPVCKKDMLDRGWERPDFLFVTGDAYVDHPSFGHAVISRLLEAEGFRVAILAQPDWTSAASFAALGEPALGVLVASGVVDSMVSHYTAAKKRRSEDDYSPGGKSGFRPDRAVITYCNRIRSVFRDAPLIIGGIEASLRRFSHYDYWDDRVRSSILANSGADLIVYGMGEFAIAEVARRLRAGEPIGAIKDVPGTVYMDSEEGLARRMAAGAKNGGGAAAGDCAVRGDCAAGGDCAVRGGGASADPHAPACAPVGAAHAAHAAKRGGGAARFVELPSADDVATSKKAYASAFMAMHGEQDPIRGGVLWQRHGNRVVVQNPPAPPLSMAELDRIYALPYERAWHPSYDAAGGVPALEEVKFSVASHRGCFGGCAFCAITLHQGRIVQKRSFRSILDEVGKLAALPGFKGYIHDVGGPTANFRNPSCKRQLKAGTCKNRQCMYPRPCPHLDVSHSDYLGLLRKVREAPGVKKVFVRSGIRFDYVMLDGDRAFLRELCEHHVSGQLKVAPEHVSRRVLGYMGKPGGGAYEDFCRLYLQTNMRLGVKQYLVPYLISGHPGCALADAVQLSEYLREKKYAPEQVQDFYPTPGTMSTCMYYTGIDPRTMKKVHIPGAEEKAMQRALLQYRRPENRQLVTKALKLASRGDLIGYGPKCLVAPGPGPGPARPERRNSGGGASGGAKPERRGSGGGAAKQERRGSGAGMGGGAKPDKRSGGREAGNAVKPERRSGGAGMGGGAKLERRGSGGGMGGGARPDKRGGGGGRAGAKRATSRTGSKSVGAGGGGRTGAKKAGASRYGAKGGGNPHSGAKKAAVSRSGAKRHAN